MKSLLGYKEKQTQTFTERGVRIPVTYIRTGPCYVTKIETTPTYTNIQLGFGMRNSINKPLQGTLKKAGVKEKPRFLRSIRVPDSANLTVGKEIKVADVFTEGDRIRVTGMSKGKGFAGVVKRHGFAGGPKTHGQSDRERAPGSIGQTTTPGRVYRGKRMAGKMGQDKVTVKGLRVVSVDSKNNLLVVMGLVPGPVKGMVVVSKE
jgi:large subunit ribosomal protein L3